MKAGCNDIFVLSTQDNNYSLVVRLTERPMDYIYVPEDADDLVVVVRDAKHFEIRTQCNCDLASPKILSCSFHRGNLTVDDIGKLRCDKCGTRLDFSDKKLADFIVLQWAYASSYL